MKLQADRFNESKSMFVALDKSSPVFAGGHGNGSLLDLQVQCRSAHFPAQVKAGNNCPIYSPLHTQCESRAGGA